MTDVMKVLALAKYRAIERAAFRRIRAVAEELQTRERDLIAQRDALAARVATADGLPLADRVRLQGAIQNFEAAWSLHLIDKRGFVEKLDILEAAMPGAR